jgi:cysteine desulfurase
VDEHGLLNVVDVEKAIRPETILITLMHANNEVGTIQPIEEVAHLAKSRGIVFHTDAAQSVGESQQVRSAGGDLLTAGHKLDARRAWSAHIRDGIPWSH